jgi:transposase-like protein
MKIIEAIGSASEVEFSTEEKCIDYLEKLRWPEGIRCLSCGHEKISRIRAKGRLGKVRLLYQCLEKSCRYQFSATTGTIFHDSHLPLQKWFLAISMVSKDSEKVAVNQLRHSLGVQYKTAQHVVERIREAVKSGTVEIDLGRKNVAPVRKVPDLPFPVAPPANRWGEPETAFFTVTDAGGTAVGSMLSMFRSVAQFTVRSPLYVANYLITKVSLDA